MGRAEADAGAQHFRTGGENDVIAFLHGFLHRRHFLLRCVHLEPRPGVHLRHFPVQVGPALFVVSGPGTGFRIPPVNECGPGFPVEPGEQGLAVFLCVGFHHRPRFFRPDGEIRPDFADLPLELTVANVVKVLQAVDLQKQQEGIAGGNLQLASAEFQENLREAVPGRPHILPHFFTPGPVICAQNKVQPLPAAGGDEVQIGCPGFFLRFQGLEVGFHFRRMVVFRNQPGDFGHDLRRLQVFQDRDPLVSFLDIEMSEVFDAQDRLPDAFLQLCFIQTRPFSGELTRRLQQGHEIRRKGIRASARAGSRDAVQGNGRDRQLLGLQNFQLIVLQCRQVGIQALRRAGFYTAQSDFPCLFIYFKGHTGPPFFVSLFIILCHIVRCMRRYEPPLPKRRKAA